MLYSYVDVLLSCCTCIQMYPYHVIYPLFVADALARLDKATSPQHRVRVHYGRMQRVEGKR